MLSKLLGRFAKCLFRNPYFRVYLRDFTLTEVTMREQYLKRKEQGVYIDPVNGPDKTVIVYGHYEDGFLVVDEVKVPDEKEK